MNVLHTRKLYRRNILLSYVFRIRKVVPGAATVINCNISFQLSMIASSTIINAIFICILPPVDKKLSKQACRTDDFKLYAVNTYKEPFYAREIIAKNISVT